MTEIEQGQEKNLRGSRSLPRRRKATLRRRSWLGTGHSRHSSLSVSLQALQIRSNFRSALIAQVTVFFQTPC